MKYMVFMKKIVFVILCLSAFCALAMPQAAVGQDTLKVGDNALDYLLQKRPQRPGFAKGRFSEHTFLTGMIGPSYLSANGAGNVGNWKNYSMLAGVYYGKWFSPVSGFRVGLGLGYVADKATVKTQLATFGVDYLMNLSALASGYDYDRLFEMSAVFGAEYLRKIEDSPHPDQFGGHVGLQAKFHVSPLVDILVEPRLNIYTDNIEDISSWRNYNTSAGIMAGVSYNMVPLEKRTSEWRFEKERFLEGTFLSAGAGIRSFIGYGNSGLDKIMSSVGPSFRLSMGKWVTSMSAFRLSGEIGFMDRNEAKIKSGELMLDYLFNLNSAFGGYDRDRKFELSFLAGANLLIDKYKSGGANKVLGGALGLNGNIRLNGYTSLYIEPRLDFYGSNVLGAYSNGNFMGIGSLNVGVNFIRASHSDFMERGQVSFKDPLEKVFISSGMGVNTLLQRGRTDGKIGHYAPQLSMSLGKWFTSVSALRLSAEGGIVKSDKRNVSGGGYRDIYHRYGALSADYMFNVNSAMCGYREGRVFELSALAGVSLGGLTSAEGQLYFGLNAGLQGLFNITDNWGLYVEPRLILYDKNFTSGIGFIGRTDMLASVNFGVNYKFNSYAAKGASLDERDGRNFVSVSEGGLLRITGSSISGNMFKWLGNSFKISYGRWFSPVSIVRVGMTFDNTPLYMKGTKNDDIRSRFIGVTADYMFDLTAANRGYDPSRLFSVRPFLGINAGMAKVESGKEFAFGASAGFNFDFRVSRFVSIFAEPRLALFGDNYDLHDRYSRLSPMAELNAGLSFHF